MGKRKVKRESEQTSADNGARKSRRLDRSSAVSASQTNATGDDRLLWGPYLSERQWGTVREDTSLDGSCWESFTHDEAVYRSYAWGEDGLMGLCDDQATLCLALALWNGKDPILKERLYGMTGPQGNHGEDVKECYYYLDSTPSHCYMKALYKYPQCTFPYQHILEETRSRDATQPEYEILDTGVFDNSNYFDVYAEYAKKTSKDILCRYTVHNRSDAPADIHIIPQIWFRKLWSGDGNLEKGGKIQKLGDGVICSSERLGRYIFEYSKEHDPSAIYTENETNTRKLEEARKTKSGKRQKLSHSTLVGTKDAFHEYVINGNIAALSSKSQGSKFGAHYQIQVPAQGHVTVKCRLVAEEEAQPIGFEDEFDLVFEKKIQEADEFYKQVIPRSLTEGQAAMARQAYAGLCWNKQFFYYDLKKWLKMGGEGRINKQWGHMLNSDVISMPDKWEFPWYATWDLAFHMVPMTDLDPEFVQSQLLLLLSQRYMHPKGQLPAYEFDFSDVNPPVHGLAVLHVYRRTRDRAFLIAAFNKLNLNFNWWMTNKQMGDTFLFGGGFLGMDNVSCLHRSQLPDGCTLYQVDGTCWMAYFALCMLQMALELSEESEAYVDMVITYLDYFMSIAYALNYGLDGEGLYDWKDRFYYDRLKVEGDPELKMLRVRAMIGLTTLFPVYTIEPSTFEKIPTLKPKILELLKIRPEIQDKMLFGPDHVNEKSAGMHLSLFPCILEDRHAGVLSYLGREDEFLAPGGIRALSKYHKDHPFSITVGEEVHTVEYNPGESQCDMFGGNSNWRGPVWFPMNYLLVESLEAFQRIYKSMDADYRYKIQVPSEGNREYLPGQFAQMISLRLVSLFLPDLNGMRPCHGIQTVYAQDKHWKDLVLFYEYFDGDTGRGCGASHQTGWTALVTTLLKKLYQI